METYLIILILILAVLLAALLISSNRLKKDWSEKLAGKDIEINSLKIEKARAEEQATAQKNALEETKNSLKATFDSSAASALKNNNEQFLALAGQTLKTYLTQSEGEHEKRKQAIENLVKPLTESLNKHEQIVKDLENNSQKTFGNVQTLLDSLQTSQVNLTKETGALVSALKNPRVRGRWGEIGLRRIVEFSGMSEFCDFDEQVSQSFEDGRLRPDMIVRLPGGHNVVVDSKLALNAYLDALETEDEREKDLLLTKHVSDVRGHMNKLSKKEYWSQFNPSPDFVVYYIEIESAYSAALEKDHDLIQDSMNNKIIFATPSTLIVILRSIALSWKQQAIADNAKEIWQVGAELHERLKVFAGHLSGVGRNLDQAGKAYNDAIGSWDSRVMPVGRKLQELGATKDKGELPESKYVETSLRELKVKGDNQILISE